MDRHGRIESVAFGETDLPLPLAVRFGREAAPRPAGDDADAFATSLQLDRPALTAEVRLRGTAVAETLSLGDQADLLVVVGASRAGQASRTITLAGAVLVACELLYDRSALAEARLRFAAEAPDGAADPFTAQETP